MLFSYLLLLSVVSSIKPESLPFDELWELRMDWRPCDRLSLSLSPESFPLESPSISSELWPRRPPDPDLTLGDEPPMELPPFPLSCSWVTLSLGGPLLVFSEFNSSDSASWSLYFFSSALATRPRVLVLGIDLESSKLILESDEAGTALLRCEEEKLVFKWDYYVDTYWLVVKKN